MDLAALKQSLSAAQPPAETSDYINALWYDAKGNWEKAHTIIQDITDANASWIHAYLHRKEGDVSNARYWYNKAGKTMPLASLEKEWADIVSALL